MSIPQKRFDAYNVFLIDTTCYLDSACSNEHYSSYEQKLVTGAKINY